MSQTDGQLGEQQSGEAARSLSSPLLALSGAGAVIGALTKMLKRVKRVSTKWLVSTSRFSTKLPKSLKSRYIKYPAFVLLLLATTRTFTSTNDRIAKLN